MIYFTSDWHFGHDKDFIWRDRGFSSVKEMNEELVKRFNSVVSDDDIVYVLGDLILGDLSNSSYVERLNGKLNIIRGNHDTPNRMSKFIQLDNVVTYHNAGYFTYGKYKFYLTHFPCITSNIDDDKNPWQRIINLYGHTHQTNNFYKGNPYMYHVGVDSHDMFPVSIEKILEDIKEAVDGK